MKVSDRRKTTAYDTEALKPEAGVRALWLLYRRGQWGLLEDSGLHRENIEPIFSAFSADNIIGPRLTKAQVRRLVALTPGLEEASIHLRIDYALHWYEKERGNNDKVLPRGGTAAERKRV
jgi:hypothetical protein